MIDNELQKHLRCKFNPDGSELRDLQLRMLQMLNYFDQFCTKHNLKYWLSSGTCLGAVRHGGFIPWDDDLDIEMLPEDYNTLLELSAIYEDSHNILQDYKTDKEYISPHGKLRDKQSELKEIHNRDKYFNYKGVFIDVFVREQGSFIAAKISHIVQYASYYITDIKNKHLRRIMKNIVYHGMHSILFPCLRLYNTLFGNKKELRHTLGCSFYKTIKKDGLFPLKRIEFEGKLFPVPGNYECYLERLYGNYMKLPKNFKNLRTHFTQINLKN